MIHQGEIIIGRARWQERLALLTDAPALVVIDARTGTHERRRIEDIPNGFHPWGLGEHAGELYTVSGFGELTRLTSGHQSRRLAEALGNVFDTAEGMAAQLAVDDTGKPLVWSLDPGGSLAPFDAPARASFGLSRAEDSLLHLLTCSAPPAVVCWMAGSRELYRQSSSGLVLWMRPEGIRVPPAADLIATPDLRAVDDVAVVGEGVLILHKPAATVRTQQLDLFDRSGRKVKSLALSEPLRLLLEVAAGEVIALSATGHIVKVGL